MTCALKSHAILSSLAQGQQGPRKKFIGIRDPSHSVPVPIFSAPARPLSRVIGGAETGVLLSIIIMMISMLNIGKARQL